jgi:NAD(P)-dependent dehydrogenase (short-subunit alcohol dehydrogenase family)
VNVAGKVALVTGGASGLGLATARLLAASGASVALVDLSASAGDDAVASVGGGCLFVPADVTSAAAVEEAVDATVKSFGALHVVVSCAGVATPGRVLHRDGTPLALDDFERVVHINLVGTFNVIRVAAAQMASQEPDGEERGVLVNTASVAAFEGQVGQAAYSASKGGIASLTLTVARDLADRRIRCVAIAPGTFDTPMMASLGGAVRAKLEANTPHPNRLGSPEEFAMLVGHIVANPMLNGEVIRLDGALRMPPR